MFKNRINACGHSSDSLSGGGTMHALRAIPPFYTHCAVSDHERGIPPCQLLNVFQTALREVAVNGKVERKVVLLDPTVINISVQNNLKYGNVKVRTQADFLREILTVVMFFLHH